MVRDCERLATLVVSLTSHARLHNEFPELVDATRPEVLESYAFSPPKKLIPNLRQDP